MVPDIVADQEIEEGKVVGISYTLIAAFYLDLKEKKDRATILIEKTEAHIVV